MKSVQLLMVLVTLIITTTNGSIQADETLIETGDAELGNIVGSTAIVMEDRIVPGRKYYWYTGIPYANPDSYTGDNRFKPSEVWNGVLPHDEGDDTFRANGNKSCIYCLQEPIVDLGGKWCKPQEQNPFEMIKSYYNKRRSPKKESSTQEMHVLGQEDCLIVTVSTPKLPKGESPKLLPVIYFIHGGGFDAFWGSVFGGQRLLKHDVVLVSMNYRLGVLGSLNLGIEDAPGNAALYDCITGLKWVNRYIHHFGGDPNKVTVAGQSAGAVLATSVFLSPLAKGLFHGVIGDSGSALSVWANQKNPIEENMKVIGFTDCKNLLPATGLPNPAQAQELRNCMGKLTPEQLINARDEYGVSEHLNARMGYDAFVPSVQSVTVPAPALSKTPRQILSAGEQNNVPLMMGATRHDGSFVFLTTFYDYLAANGLDSDPDFIKNKVLYKFLNGVGVEDPTGALIHSLSKTYMGDAANSDDIISKIPGLLDIHSVLGFKAGGYGLVEAHSKMNNSYYYAFDYKGWFTTYDIANGKSIIPGGIAHVDDLLYMFQLIPLVSEKDWRVSDRYVSYWANFATYGNPNGPNNLDRPFPLYSNVDHPYLSINETDSVRYHCRDSWVGNAQELM